MWIFCCCKELRLLVEGLISEILLNVEKKYGVYKCDKTFPSLQIPFSCKIFNISYSTIFFQLIKYATVKWTFFGCKNFNFLMTFHLESSFQASKCNILCNLQLHLVFLFRDLPRRNEPRWFKIDVKKRVD